MDVIHLISSPRPRRLDAPFSTNGCTNIRRYIKRLHISQAKIVCSEQPENGFYLLCFGSFLLVCLIVFFSPLARSCVSVYLYLPFIMPVAAVRNFKQKPNIAFISMTHLTFFFLSLATKPTPLYH